MPDLSHITHYTGNRSPALTDTITSDGVVVDLAGASVKFQMRLVGSTTLKVDTAATIVTPAAGTVRYDWAALDVNTPGFYVGWWHFTLSGGNLQDTPEFIVEIRDHAPVANEYVSVEELKSSLSLAGQAFADADIQIAISAASRAIDQATGRRFYPDTVDQTREYVPMNPGYVMIDDLSSFTILTVGGSSFGTLDTDFYLEPINAMDDSQAWTGIRTIWKPFIWDASGIAPGMAGPDARVRVTGKFGWATCPPEIQQATRILATRLMRRSREAAFGVLGLGMDGAAVRIVRDDPDVNTLVAPYVRLVAF